MHAPFTFSPFCSMPGFQQFLQHPYVSHVRAVLAQWHENPDLLRRILRDQVPAQILVCALMSAPIAGLIVLLHRAIMASHALIFDIPVDTHLSAAPDIAPLRVLLVPLLGGLVLGVIALLARNWAKHEIVDPIEANAVHGGKLSLRGSGRLIGASFLSNVFGGSVGMEAAYTQLGSSMFSAIGKLLHLRRDDMRIFVAAGAAAAIAAAFNAPLAGAFYGFELVLGAYTVNAISHVAVAALFGALTAQLFTHGEPIFALPLESVHVPDWYYLLFLIQGIAAAMIGIITMMAVTRCEQLTRTQEFPDWMRPAVGGAALGLIAVMCPQVLGSGQGAINEHLHESWPITAVIILLGAKILGSALSIGTGFRGGLFSTSLLIGCLFGQIFGLMVGHFLPQGQENLDIFMLVGMGAVAASIVGAPVTIVLLILEMTGNFPAATSVLMGVLVASAITRHYFGYSFSTWRFHLRGLRIRGAHDVGWIEELTVERLMRTDVVRLPADTSFEQIEVALKSRPGRRVYVVGRAGQYLGMIDRAALDAKAELRPTAGELAKLPECYLLREHNIQQALQTFAQWEAERLPVLDAAHQVVGSLTEAYILRRYAQELEARNLAQFGVASPASA